MGSCGPLLSLAQAGSCDMLQLQPPWLLVHGCQPVLPCCLGLTVNKKEPLLALFENLNLAHLISKILVDSRYRKLCRRLRRTNHSEWHQVDICCHSQLNPLFCEFVSFCHISSGLVGQEAGLLLAFKGLGLDVRHSNIPKMQEFTEGSWICSKAQTQLAAQLQPNQQGIKRGV